jgi:enamine deaminase RidA (YjgF/YER057c/UK114 family)
LPFLAKIDEKDHAKAIKEPIMSYLPILIINIWKNMMKYIQIKPVLHNLLLEYYLYGHCEYEHASLFLTELLSFFNEYRVSPVNLRFFATKKVFELVNPLFDGIRDSITCPITWILQPEKKQIPSLSFQAHAIRTEYVQVFYDHDRIAGCRFNDGYAAYLHLNVLSEPKPTKYDSAACVFESMQRRLESAGSDFSHTLRTWLFADDILSWYGQLNLARDDFFRQHDIFNKLVPASTGIGVSNPFGAVLSTELLAVEPLNGRVQIAKVTSPLQCEALDYRSSFSRAVTVSTPDCRRMYVSGTASIASDGLTVNSGNCTKQIELTMQVVQALIHNGEMDWSNTVQAIAYFKDSRDFTLFDTYCQTNRLNLPHIKIEADICRNDLLFELELSLLSVNRKLSC